MSERALSAVSAITPKPGVAAPPLSPPLILAALACCLQLHWIPLQLPGMWDEAGHSACDCRRHECQVRSQSRQHAPQSSAAAARMTRAEHRQAPVLLPWDHAATSRASAQSVHTCSSFAHGYIRSSRPSLRGLLCLYRFRSLPGQQGDGCGKGRNRSGGSKQARWCAAAAATEASGWKRAGHRGPWCLPAVVRGAAAFNPLSGGVPRCACAGPGPAPGRMSSAARGG